MLLQHDAPLVSYAADEVQESEWPSPLYALEEAAYNHDMAMVTALVKNGAQAEHTLPLPYVFMTLYPPWHERGIKPGSPEEAAVHSLVRFLMAQCFEYSNNYDDDECAWGRVGLWLQNSPHERARLLDPVTLAAAHLPSALPLLLTDDVRAAISGDVMAQHLTIDLDGNDDPLLALGHTAMCCSVDGVAAILRELSPEAQALVPAQSLAHNCRPRLTAGAVLALAFGQPGSDESCDPAYGRPHCGPPPVQEAARLLALPELARLASSTFAHAETAPGDGATQTAERQCTVAELVNLCPGDGIAWSPLPLLHHALWPGNTAVINLLLKQGADPNLSKPAEGVPTPLRHYVRVLLESHGKLHFDSSIAVKPRMHPSCDAITRPSWELADECSVITLLLEAGAAVSAEDVYLAAHIHPQLVQLLIQHAPHFVNDVSGGCMLLTQMLLTSYSHQKALVVPIRALLAAGAAVNWTPDMVQQAASSSSATASSSSSSSSSGDRQLCKESPASVASARGAACHYAHAAAGGCRPFYHLRRCA